MEPYHNNKAKHHPFIFYKEEDDYDHSLQNGDDGIAEKIVIVLNCEPELRSVSIGVQAKARGKSKSMCTSSILLCVCTVCYLSNFIFLIGCQTKIPATATKSIGVQCEIIKPADEPTSQSTWTTGTSQAPTDSDSIWAPEAQSVDDDDDQMDVQR